MLKYNKHDSLIQILLSNVTCPVAQGRLPPNMPRWHIDYFKLKLMERQQEQKENSGPPLSP